jgi:hypothetical protein
LQVGNSSERLERMKAAIRKVAGFDNKIVEMITNEEEVLEVVDSVVYLSCGLDLHALRP